MKKSLSLLLILVGSHCFSQSVSYELSMPKPQNHYFHVEMTLKDFKEKSLDVSLPVWIPGSYLIREFSKNINLVKAFGENGEPLKVKKKSKNTWCISKGKQKKVTIKYEVYSFELSVRTSFLDLTHGFVSGSGVFMFVEKHKDISGQLNIVPYEGFSKISTSLPLKDGSKEFTYSFSDYDQLVDCPIEIGNHELIEFEAAGVNHSVAMFGSGNYFVEDIIFDLSKIIEEETKVFGQNPNKNYLFIVHNVVNGQGGLEHTNSTTLSVNRWTYGGSNYVKFLNLVAHEYFHLWNVKRIRPIELGPFDYNKENYTDLLWVMEGFTSYYDELILQRAGYYTQSQFLNKLQGSINYVEGSVGSRVQPVAHASYDAWIKSYRPNENSPNTTMSYYSRGSVIAALLDIMIIKHSDGKKCLDHFMQSLYENFYVKKNRGFTSKEFKSELEVFVGKNLDEFYEKYIDGTEIPPYKEIFGLVGLDVNDASSTYPDFGAQLRSSGGKTIIKSIRSGSAAEDAGLSVNDEIIACNGYRVDKADIESIMKELLEGDSIDLLISRDEILFSVNFTMTNRTKNKFYLNVSDENDKLYNYWLR